MKKLFYFSSLIAILFISSCSKDDGTADPAGEVAGTYQVIGLEVNGYAQPISQGGISGTVKLSRRDAVSADLTVSILSPTGSTLAGFKAYALVSKSGNSVSLKFSDDRGYSDNGYIEDKKVYLDFYDGDHVKIQAKK